MDDKAEKVALFRYGLIAPLVLETLPRGELTRRAQQIAARLYDFPHSTRRQVSVDTLLDWTLRYRRNGLPALSPKPRQDRGQARAVATDIRSIDRGVAIAAKYRGQCRDPSRRSVPIRARTPAPHIAPEAPRGGRPHSNASGRNPRPARDVRTLAWRVFSGRSQLACTQVPIPTIIQIDPRAWPADSSKSQELWIEQFVGSRPRLFLDGCRPLRCAGAAVGRTPESPARAGVQCGQTRARTQAASGCAPGQLAQVEGGQALKPPPVAPRSPTLKPTAANNVSISLAAHARDCTADAGRTLLMTAIPATAAAPPLKADRAVCDDGRMKKLAFVLALLPTLAPAQSPAYHDPGMKAVTQVAIVCRDIEATSRRWASVLGVAPPRILTIKPGNEAKLVYRGHPSNGRAKLAFLNLGQVTLELIQPVGNDTAWKEFLDTHGEGVHHVAFQVADPDKTIKEFQAVGMPVQHQGRFDDDSGSYVYIDSAKALGVTLELLHTDAKK